MTVATRSAKVAGWFSAAVVVVVLAHRQSGEGVRLEGDAVVDNGGGDLGGDAADDLLLVALECSAEDVDVAGHAARTELTEKESALEDEVLLAEWVDANAVEEPFDQVLEHDLVGECAGAAAGRMTDIPPSSRAAPCKSATPCWPVRRR